MSQPWMKFYPRDWRGDQALRAVSIAARGFWMECLCIMHEAKPYGHLLLNGEKVEGDTLARMTGTSTEEATALLAELTKAGVLSVTGKGVVFSRRMTKDHSRSTKGRKAVEKRYTQDIETKQETNGPSRLPTREPTTQKPDARYQKERDSSLPLGDPVEADFDEWYVLYPHKVGRGAALKAYRSARKKTGKGELLESVKRFAAAKARDGTEKRFIPHPATWLNGERWADEAQPSSQASSPATGNGQARPGEYQARDPADFDLEDWSIRIRLYRQNGKWAEMWGPRPPAEGNIADIARTYLQRHRRAA